MNQYDTTLLQTSQNLIICEPQEEHFCGRHALRALVQRLDLFDDEYLINIAENLTAQEQIVLDGERVNATNYYYPTTGDYGIQILKAALMNVFQIDLFQIRQPELITDNIQRLILSNLQNAQGFLIQQDYHYYCLRRFRSNPDYFFKIDSKSPIHHETIQHEHLLNFFYILWEHGANIYMAIQNAINDINDELCESNIKTRLWPFSDAPVDVQPILTPNTSE